jgi:hypothetical protein
MHLLECIRLCEVRITAHAEPMIPNFITNSQVFKPSIVLSIPYLNNFVPKRAGASVGLSLEPTKGREECKRDPLKSPVLGFNNTGAGRGRARLA